MVNGQTRNSVNILLHQMSPQLLLLYYSLPSYTTPSLLLQLPVLLLLYPQLIMDYSYAVGPHPHSWDNPNPTNVFH